MIDHADKTPENKSPSVSAANPQMESGIESTFQFVDNRPKAVAQRKMQEMANHSPRSMQLEAFQKMANNSPQAKKMAMFQEMADNSRQAKQAIQLVKGAGRGKRQKSKGLQKPPPLPGRRKRRIADQETDLAEAASVNQVWEEQVSEHTEREPTPWHLLQEEDQDESQSEEVELLPENEEEPEVQQEEGPTPEELEQQRQRKANLRQVRQQHRRAASAVRDLEMLCNAAGRGGDLADGIAAIVQKNRRMKNREEVWDQTIDRDIANIFGNVKLHLSVTVKGRVVRCTQLMAHLNTNFVIVESHQAPQKLLLAALQRVEQAINITQCQMLIDHRQECERLADVLSNPGRGAHGLLVIRRAAANQIVGIQYGSTVANAIRNLQTANHLYSARMLFAGAPQQLRGIGRHRHIHSGAGPEANDNMLVDTDDNAILGYVDAHIDSVTNPGRTAAAKAQTIANREQSADRITVGIAPDDTVYEIRD